MAYDRQTAAKQLTQIVRDLETACTVYTDSDELLALWLEARTAATRIALGGMRAGALTYPDNADLSQWPSHDSPFDPPGGWPFWWQTICAWWTPLGPDGNRIERPRMQIEQAGEGFVLKTEKPLTGIDSVRTSAKWDALLMREIVAELANDIRVMPKSGSGAEGAWSLPVSKSAIRVALGNMSPEKFDGWVKNGGITIRKDGRQQFRVRLDTIDTSLKAKLEKAGIK